jgi:hypothetical protein
VQHGQPPFQQGLAEGRLRQGYRGKRRVEDNVCAPILFSMSAASISQSLFLLPVAERVAIADQLYASVPEDWQCETDQAWLSEAGRRSKEMDENPCAELSHEEFLSGIQVKRGQA